VEPDRTTDATETKKEDLRQKIVASLISQGFRVECERIFLPGLIDKSDLRRVHETAVGHRMVRSADGLKRKQARLLERIANGADVDPLLIAPRLVEVLPDTEDELLFRFASLHWSIPVSSGYGRRLRYLVTDDQNDALMGIIGICDPVFALKRRDLWIGWSRNDARERLHLVADAFVLGATPPYAQLLCGKLVALLTTSDEVWERFEEKYRDSSALISRRKLSGQTVLLTTTSALGRSSIYNRLSYRDRKAFESVGFTKGSGDFHFANGLYDEIRTYALNTCEPTAKNSSWGSGFRNRREVVRKALGTLGLPLDWQYHGVEREVFVAPLVSNAREILRGEQTEPSRQSRTAQEVASWFRERWLLPRAQWDKRYLAFRKDSYALWQ